MNKRIREYLEYRKNKKIAKRELARITATILPVARKISDKGIDIVSFIIKITNEAKNMEGEQLLKMVLNEISTVLQSDNKRIVEILTYMANLTPEDIQKILVDSVVETMHTDEDDA